MNSKLKPFDLEAAKNGAPVVTRDGRPVRIICTDAMDCDYPIVALVKIQEGEGLKSYTLGGKYISDGEKSNADLFMAPVKRRGWVNLYRGSSGLTYSGNCVHDSEEEALGRALGDHRGHIATVPVEWEE